MAETVKPEETDIGNALKMVADAIGSIRVPEVDTVPLANGLFEIARQLSQVSVALHRIADAQSGAL